jgi:type VI secretion system secreted protein Hcp
MKICRSWLPGVCAVFSLLSTSFGQVGEAQTDIHIDAKFSPPIAGDSQTPGHAGEISIVSFKFGVTQKGTAVTGSGLGAGKAIFTPMTLYKYLDKASAKLFVNCAKGTHFKSMVLTVSEANIENPEVLKSILKIQLNTVQFSSVNTDSSTVDTKGNLVESIVVEYVSAFWTFTGADGETSSGGYDLKANKELTVAPPL